MGYDGAGNYTRTHNWSADASANIKILASRQDQEWDDMASAMNLAVLRDGRAAMTGDLPMGGHRIVNAGGPASASNYIRAKDFIENVPIYVVDSESSADRISVSTLFYTTASAATAPRDGSKLIIKAGSDKSSAVAIRLNTGDGNPHSAGVVLSNGSAIYSGAIQSGGIYEFMWSSADTAWQILNPHVAYATSAFPGVIQIATSAEVAAGTDVPKAITPAQLAAKFSADYATPTSAGFVKLATTADISTGTDASAVITPAVLHSYVSAATTASAGLLEIATTAEVTTGTATNKAITPALLSLVTPYIAVFAAVSGAETVITRNSKASTFSIAAIGGGAQFRVTHGLNLTSAHELTISLLVETTEEFALRDVIVNMFDPQTSSFSFNLREASTNASVSANVHMVAYRVI